MPARGLSRQISLAQSHLATGFLCEFSLHAIAPAAVRDPVRSRVAVLANFWGAPYFLAFLCGCRDLFHAVFFLRLARVPPAVLAVRRSIRASTCTRFVLKAHVVFNSPPQKNLRPASLFVAVTRRHNLAGSSLVQSSLVAETLPSRRLPRPVFSNPAGYARVTSIESSGFGGASPPCHRSRLRLRPVHLDEGKGRISGGPSPGRVRGLCLSRCIVDASAPMFRVFTTRTVSSPSPLPLA